MSGLAQRVRRIAICGKSHELWPVATLIANDLPADIELVLVEDGGSVAPAAVAVRLDDPFFAYMGISAEKLATADSALFSLGAELRDWQGEGSGFFLTGSGSLPAIDDVAIHQIMLHAAMSYDQPERLSYLYQPFRLPARAMEVGKIAFQSADPRSPLSMLRPVVQIDREHYTALLKDNAGSGPMRIVDARPKVVQTSPDGGAIDRIELDNGETVEADLYIDASGAISRLIGGSFLSDWRSVSEGFSFDRIGSARVTDPPAGPASHTVVQAIKGGLMITTPLRDRSIGQFIYASDLLTGEEEKHLVGPEAEVASFEPGYIDKPWLGNLLRMGSASARFGPFLSADMTLLQRQAMILADHLPTRLDMTVEAREFNRRNLIAAEQLRDFMLLPFALNRREDLPWSDIGERKMPVSLVRRIDQFRSRGRVVVYDGEIFDEQSWIDIMIGFGVVPERCDPLTQGLDMTIMARRLKNLAGAFDRSLLEMGPCDGAVGNLDMNVR
ncbi:tryptophan 7-halogenase [Parasphingorhabdus flavimaris]|uniref:tryptophan 7-halogenase n=1 Tax=Parasphingorhabdus flavimaris TaxID=266812 RepID=UPI0030017828